MRKRDPLRSRPPPNPYPKQRKISNCAASDSSKYIATQDAMMEKLLGLMKKQPAHQSENGNNELIYCTITIRLFITIYFKNCYSD